MKNAGNIETQDSQINTEKEVKQAKNVQSAFKNQLANISDPIDSFTYSNNTQAKAKGEFDEVSVKDLMALLDDTELDIDKVNTYIKEKPVSAETKSTLANVGKVETPKETKEMAEISDADTNVVMSYIDIAYSTGRNEDIRKQTESSKEGIDGLGIEIYNGLMEAFYA